MSKRARAWRTGAIGVAALVLLSVIGLEPPAKESEVAATSDNATRNVDDGLGVDGEAIDGAAVDGAVTDTGGAAATDPANPNSPAAKAQTKDGKALECRAGANGGATDKGVSGNRIKLAATNVRSGTGSSFLGTSYVGMQAVVNRINSAGGVCGRLLELRIVDDGWDAARGATFLQNFANEDYFALPVVPSSEGLTTAIKNGTIDKAGIPVVGTDGMLKEQYTNPWVWPVATSTVSTMRIMAKHAFDKGARTFGIVYDEKYKFGIEGANAFADYVKRLPGASLKANVGITPGKASYSSDANKFNQDCGAEGCQFVAMLLTPETANQYISSQPDAGGDRKKGFGTMLTGGAQPLFNARFGRDCGKYCEGMLVWTGYNPAIGGLSSLKDVAQYVNDVKSVDPGVDTNNQFLEGAYLGMRLFVHALEQAGPNLTRARLRQVLDATTYKTDLSSPLAWISGQHFANQTAQAFRIATASGSFADFADAETGFIRDPMPGVIPG
jgi:ABC-type branched-subunit amino acid transport system substrate-binding protein